MNECRHNCGLVAGYCTDCERQIEPLTNRFVVPAPGPDANTRYSLAAQGVAIKQPTSVNLPAEDAARKALPIFTFLTEYFPDVIVELTKLCVNGNIQHNPELAPADIKWAREKSKDQMNTAFRHMWDRKMGLHYDTDTSAHLVKAIWRLMAQRQLDIEQERKNERT